MRALRDATPFDIPLEVLVACLAASPKRVRNPERLAVLESDLRALLLDSVSLPAERRASARPVLGNVGEAVTESVLVEAGWSPLVHDSEGMSFGHGVDLLMLDASAQRVVAVEVKSTIQRSRWPRLGRGAVEQMTPEWLDRELNAGMRDLEITSSDVYVMVAQVHLQRRQWRACIGPDAFAPRALVTEEQIHDLTWVDV